MHTGLASGQRQIKCVGTFENQIDLALLTNSVGASAEAVGQQIWMKVLPIRRKREQRWTATSASRPLPTCSGLVRNIGRPNAVRRASALRQSGVLDSHSQTNSACVQWGGAVTNASLAPWSAQPLERRQEHAGSGAVSESVTSRNGESRLNWILWNGGAYRPVIQPMAYPAAIAPALVVKNPTVLS